MPISGLVLDLKEKKIPEEFIGQDMLELGELYGHKLPAVLDTISEKENKKAWHWLNNHDVINHIDVVFVSFEEDIV